MTGTVSVCIPAYNSADYIGRTVTSVLDQTYPDVELFVVDDCSTDATAEVLAGFAEDPRVHIVVNERNLGAVGNWNRTLALAGGPYVKLVCGDDVLYPSCLERQVEALELHPQASMAAARRDIIDERDRVLFKRRGLSGLAGLVAGHDAIRAAVRSGTNPFGEPFSVLIRRTAVEEVGEFRDRAYVIDLDYWTRILQVGDLVAIPESLGAFRVVPTSWSRRIGREQSAQATALFEALRREMPEVISAVDVRRGAVAARAQQLARLAHYRALRV